MPFKSEKQRRYMYAKHPKIADKWEKEARVAGYAKKGSAVGKAVAKATGGRAPAVVKKTAAKKAAAYVRTKKGK